VLEGKELLEKAKL